MSDDKWDLKKIDAQIETLKSSLSSLKGVCSSSSGSFCHGQVSCNTASALSAVCNAMIPVIENEIKYLNYMKNKLIYFAKPNADYFDVSKKPKVR